MVDLPDEKTIPLRRPIEHAGSVYTELKVREPTAGELMEFDKFSGREADIYAVSLLAGVPRGAVEKIPARQFLAAARYVAAFLGEDLPTGESA